MIVASLFSDLIQQTVEISAEIPCLLIKINNLT